MIILILLTLSFHITNIVAIACDNYHIDHLQQNDSLTINFPSNDLLKLDRRVRCTSTSSFNLVNGCAYYCTGLGYGKHDTITVELDNDLQSPALAFFNIIDNKVRLGIVRPTGSFDYVNVQCPNNESYILFNNTTPFNDSLVYVDCSFITNLPLMSFVLETIKKDYNSAVNHISREVPLPISFTYSFNSRLLVVKADPPPLMNTYSTYEFQLIFYDQNNESISYERAKVSNLQSNLPVKFEYGLIPNLKHKIIFKHIVNSIGYAQSDETIPPLSNISYPFAVTNLRVKEEFNNIILNWDDNHDSTDPIEYIVVCNLGNNSMRSVDRNTTYVCDDILFNETNIIAVLTRVVIPGYTHDRVAATTINIEPLPEIPLFEVVNNTENSITIRWNSSNNSLITNSFGYEISCGLNQSSIPIDIQLNEYKCQSLAEGTLYVITMFLVNINNTIQRSKSIYANTLLQECRYETHFYSPDLNGFRSVIIEWHPPEKNFDKIYVNCPSSYMTYEYSQCMPTMFVKCIVASGAQYTVIFTTFKSGYEWRTLNFTDIAPRDITTTTALTTTTTTITTTVPTTVTTTTTIVPTIITTTTTIVPITITTTTTIVPTTTTAAITVPTITTTTTTVPTITTTTTTVPTITTTTTTVPTITSTTTVPTTTITSTSSATVSTIIPSDCPQDGLLKAEVTLSRWRTAAIVALIIAGFLFLATVGLTILSVLLCLRNRYNNTDG